MQRNGRIHRVYLITLSFFLLSLAALLLPLALLAFSDDFIDSQIDPSLWNAYLNDGEASLSSGVLSLSKSEVSDRFPYISSKNLSLAEGMQLSIRYRLFGSYNYGAGLVLREGFLSNAQTNDNYHNLNLIQVWPIDSSGNVALAVRSLCGVDESDCSRPYRLIKTWHIDEDWHDLKVSSMMRGVYEISDETGTLFTSKPTSLSIDNLWFGNPEITPFSLNIFPSVEIDYARVTLLEPEPVGKDKIIVLPGMFGSWDYDAILNGSNGSNWKVPKWIKVYDNLLVSLENTGYELDKDLFVFAYDWRKNLFSLSDDLKEFIENLKLQGKITDSDRVDLVGHSYGGLVARAYGQEQGLGGIDQILTVGSAHYGVTQAYGAWEGMQAWNSPWWQNQMIHLLVRFNSDIGENKIDALRRLSPSIQDLLPTNDYLINDDVLVPMASMYQQNETLPRLNASVGVNLVEVLVGVGLDTFSQVKVKDPPRHEQLLGLWEDGKPTNRLTGVGDGTVLTTSAIGPFTDYTEILAEHQALISEEAGLVNVFERLGLDPGAIVADAYREETVDTVVLALRSPGTLELFDHSGDPVENAILENNGKLLFAPGLSEGEYQARVKANNETGPYVLHLGYLNDVGSNWETYGGTLSSFTEEDSVDFEIDDQKLSLETQSEFSSGSVEEYSFQLNDLLDKFAEETEMKKQLKLLRKMKSLAHKIHRILIEEGRDDEATEVAELLGDFDRWSAELIDDSDHEIKRRRKSLWMRGLKNFDKLARRLSNENKNLDIASSRLSDADEYREEKEFAKADEYYYSAWLYLKEGFGF